MELLYSDRFKKSYKNAPERVRKAFAKQVAYLLSDLRHPSLHAKKYDESLNLWQARVDRSWRFYFLIEDDRYFLVDITEHPK